MDDRAISLSENRVASSWLQLLCVQYSLLPTFKDVVEEWQAIGPPYNSRRRIEATDVVIENRIVGQPFPVGDPNMRQAGTPALQFSLLRAA